MGYKIYDINKAMGVSNTYDIVNAIRNSMGGAFATYVPLANADNVAEVGAGIMLNQTTQNEFITALVDRIGLVVLRQKLLENPLKKFKKGTLPLGSTIQEIYTDLTKENKYDPDNASRTVFARTIPDVKVLFHELNRRGVYEQTIQDSSLTTAFLSWSNFDNFISSIISAIYNSNEVDEFKYMKLLMDNYMSKGHFKVAKLPFDKSGVVNASDMHNAVKMIRSLVTRMTMASGSREYNSMGVHTRTDKSDLHLIVTPEFEATMDVDVLAQAFNMEKATLLTEITVIDEFQTPGLTAVLIDKDFFMVYDKLQKMETIRNPKGLYWNYFYHAWQVLSASRLANAVAFVDSDYDEADFSSNFGITELVFKSYIESVQYTKGMTVNSYVTPRLAIGVADYGDPVMLYKVRRADGQPINEGTKIAAGSDIYSPVITVNEPDTGNFTLYLDASIKDGTVSATKTIIFETK